MYQFYTWHAIASSVTLLSETFVGFDLLTPSRSRLYRLEILLLVESLYEM